MDKQYDPALETKEEQKVTTKKTSRRQSKSAFLVGLLMSLLSLVGVVALVMGGISWIRSATDTSALKEEVYYYLEPVMLYTPAPFENVNETEQDNLLLASAYRVMQKEQIRMLREKDDTSTYAVDENGRIAVPVEEVMASYKILFGMDATFQHRTVEDGNLEYSEADGCYYIPFETPNTGYKPVVLSIKNGWKSYKVRIGYVPITDIPLDEYGNEVEPTEEMATHFQTYTLQKEEDETYYIRACADE